MDFLKQLKAEHDTDVKKWEDQIANHKNCYVTCKSKFDVGGIVAAKASFVETARAKHQQCRKTEKLWISYKSLSCGSEAPPFFKSTAAHDVLYDAITSMRTEVNLYKTRLSFAKDEKRRLTLAKPRRRASVL